ncbi:response regulator [Pseudoxanthomonas sp. PXM01]|uniref:response regulator n=1 Tax=Pseudoxanthomonas sp. PXM01 TaxID=2769295 RepID=UPI00177F66EF|nr:response regulator [Pseudoxanthomonas sp. PXM01]MBD9469139.1 response regulator [Pseudoxanthomonas sp. PXM01]
MPSRPQVLFVDDALLLSELMVEILEDEGFAVTYAANGPEALRILRSGTSFNCVISDFSLPGCSGSEVITATVSVLPNACVILASAHPRSEVGRIPDKVHYMSKPYRMEDLLALMRR